MLSRQTFLTANKSNYKNKIFTDIKLKCTYLL